MDDCSFQNDVDIGAEILLCMQYLGLTTDARCEGGELVGGEYWAGLRNLLHSQNENGSYGRYALLWTRARK
eukprot:SAG31_NODE_471_length_15238_cov_14.684554_7_plen_71_part_00